MNNEENEEKTSLAEQFSEENDLPVEVNQAYIDNIGEEYSKAEDVAEAYQGKWSSDSDFAYDMAESMGDLSKDMKWPYTCIDWEKAAEELMYDYFEIDGYYFRNI